MLWALSGHLFCLCEVDLLVWNRDEEMVSERPRVLPKAAQQIQTQGLPLAHSVMPEGVLEEEGLWSWALGAAGLREDLTCRGGNGRYCVEGG